MRSALVGTGAVLGVVLAATATLVVLRGGGAGGCAAATQLKVVAAPAIAPTIQEIVRRDLDLTCVAARVVPQSAADTAADLAGGTGETPALWIPDSTLWPRRARQEAASRGTTSVRIEEHEPLALSPLVAVMARRDTSKIGWPALVPGWRELLGGPVATTIGDPMQTTEGLATLLMARRLFSDQAGTPQPELIAALLRVGRGAVPTVQSAYDKLESAGDALAFTATEQSVVAYNRGGGRAPVVAIYPQDGTLTLDYPVVRLNQPQQSAELTEAAQTVERALRTPQAMRTLQAAGFRAPDGLLGEGIGESAGVIPGRPQSAPLPAVDEATEVLRTWSAVTLDVRMLVVIDVSGSMDAAAGGGLTRIELARDAGLTALGFVPDSAEIGLWAFSVQQAPPNDWAELVGMGLLDADVGGTPRRQALQTAFGTLPGRTEGGTGLNDTALAAYRTQQANYDPERVNSVVILTDGRNEDSDGVSDEVLLRTLRAEADPARPVPVILIGMGPDVDFPALQAIAAATSGKAYLADNPADIRGVFLDAIIQRRCRPSC